MDVLARGALPPIAKLREQWRSATLESSWLFSDDWYQPEVDALLHALPEHGSMVAACLKLGSARAMTGCGIAETIDDVMCLFTSLGRPTPAELVRALSVGWVHADLTSPALNGCIEPDSGLHTREYLAERLRECYGVASRSGTAASDHHVLLMVDVGVGDLSFCQVSAREAGVGQILRESFNDGQAIAALGAGRYAVLLPTSDDVETTIVWLQDQILAEALLMGIETLLRTPARVYSAQLPEDEETAITLVMTIGE